MSDAAEQLQEQEPEVKAPEKPVFSLEDRAAKIKERASAQGWKDFDAHVEAGGDPEDWRDAEAFVTYGDMQKRIKDFEHGYTAKADRLERFYKAQMKAQKEELEAKLEKAIDSGDADEIRQVNKQIREHEKQEAAQTAPQQGAPDPEVTAWNNRNQGWINDPNDPRAPFAHVQWAQILKSGQYSSSAQALAELDRRIAAKFPEKDTRGHVPGSESARGRKSAAKSSRSLSWDDLRPEEIKAYEATRSGWKDKDQFLKAAKDAREAEERENGR